MNEGPTAPGDPKRYPNVFTINGKIPYRSCYALGRREKYEKQK